MASELLTIFFLMVFVLDLVSPSVTPISSAVEVLTDSGYFSMGLTLKLANKELSLEEWQELTIFAPSDQSFSKFGQPSLLDIKFHLSPARLPGETLRNLPNGAKIPTLRSNSSLTVTDSSRSGGKTSINNVVIQDSPVFDDGYVVIYGADDFFRSPMKQISNDSSLISSSSSPIPIPIHIPNSSTPSAPNPNYASGSSRNLPNRSKPVNFSNIFESASSLLISRGFVIMATFLALQLETSGGNENDTKITVLAPIDEAIPNSVAKFSDYATIFRGHVINRLLSWKDLQKLAWDGSVLKTVLKGYEIEVSLSGDILVFNGVPLIYPDMYFDEWVSVHGFNQMIEPKANQAKLGESISVLNDGEEEEDKEGVHEDYSSELGDYGLH